MAAFPRATVAAVALLVFASACEGPTADGPATRSPEVSAAALAPGDATTTATLTGSADGAHWEGEVRIDLANTGGETLPRIWLRLWANGVGGCAAPAVRAEVTEGGTGGPLARDCTALPVDLATPLAPGERTEVALDLAIDVPNRNDRFGVHDGLANLGGALPVLAVHDDDGWHLPPYVDIGESFYSLAGDYRVTLDVPAGLETPATGEVVATEETDGRIARTFEANEVRDFAWSAGALELRTGDADGVRVQVWSRPGEVPDATVRRALADAVTSMVAFDDAYGAYPYPEVDVVLASFRSFGGMEYPQLVLANPRRRVVSHELAHQWWWGLVGNDQYRSPWMDESLATWSQFLPWRPLSGDCPNWEWPSATARLTASMDYWRRHTAQYGAVYVGGACLYADLASGLGVERLLTALRDYADAHRFGVATSDDLTGAIAEAAAGVPGFDLDEVWRRWRVDTGA